MSFGYARVADGTMFTDPTFQSNFTGMKAAGMKAGGYLFFEPSQDPVAQADLLVTALEQAGFASGDLIPALDVEVTGGQSPGTLAANLQLVGNRIFSELGVYPVIYTTPGFWNGNVGSTAFGSWPLWVANWGVTCPSLPSGWSNWQVWQYADNGSIPGIPTTVDLDEANGSLPIYSGTPLPPPPPPPSPLPTTLAFTASSSTASDYTDPALVQARLTDANGPVANAQIDFSLSSSSCAAVTDTSGIAGCVLTPSEAPQTDTLVATYAGSPGEGRSSSSAPFTVSQEETALSYTGAKGGIPNGSMITLSAQLTEQGSTPIANQQVTLTLGSQSCAPIIKGSPQPLITDANGIVSCSLTVSQPLGPATITASFNGGGFYSSQKVTADGVVFAFPSQGAFAIGDQTAAGAGSSTTVTWWGASWAHENSLSGGAPPSSFKGFAATLASQPPTCAANWQSTPGPTPPATVPAYMGVLVPSSINQNGNTINGNTAHIVVVKTNPGYQPDPSQPGTGTIVANYC